MLTRFRVSSLAPDCLGVADVDRIEGTIIVTAHRKDSGAACPLCGRWSRRVHSRYVRKVMDLPSTGNALRLRIVARRFRCDVPHCRRKIFAERFGDNVLCERARRIFRTRHGSLDPHLPFLDGQWMAGCRDGAELWRRLRQQGYHGSPRVAGEWATRRRRSERATTSQFHKVLSARTIARLMTMARDHLTKADAITVAAILRLTRSWKRFDMQPLRRRKPAKLILAVPVAPTSTVQELEPLSMNSYTCNSQRHSMPSAPSIAIFIR